jgi:hypothetical protein
MLARFSFLIGSHDATRAVWAHQTDLATTIRRFRHTQAAGQDPFRGFRFGPVLSGYNTIRAPKCTPKEENRVSGDQNKVRGVRLARRQNVKWKS